jgi:hypothetical protein
MFAAETSLSLLSEGLLCRGSELARFGSRSPSLSQSRDSCREYPKLSSLKLVFSELDRLPVIDWSNLVLTPVSVDELPVLLRMRVLRSEGMASCGGVMSM